MANTVKLSTRQGAGKYYGRWYAPATASPDGLPVDATYSSPFSLTVN